MCIESSSIYPLPRIPYPEHVSPSGAKGHGRGCVDVWGCWPWLCMVYGLYRGLEGPAVLFHEVRVLSVGFEK